MSLPKLSIVMPVLNCHGTIEKAITSVIAQHYANLELIILDGGSKDGTLEIIKRYQAQISYWHSKQDGSCILAMNEGIQKATGVLVGVLMGDDWYEPETFSKIAQAVMDNPTADIISCGGRLVTSVSNQYRVLSMYNDRTNLDINLSNIFFGIPGVPAICCRFIKKSLYEHIGLYIPFTKNGKHFFSNDKEFLLRTILHQANVVHVPHLGHTYFAHSNSTTFGNQYQNVLRLCEEHQEIAEVYLQDPKINFKYQFFLHYLYNDQTTRLVLYYLLDKKFNLSKNTFKAGWKKYKIMFPIIFIYVTWKIICKRSWRLIKRLWGVSLKLV